MTSSEARFDTQAKYWRLRRSHLLESLSDADVKDLGGLCRVRVVGRGAIVYGPGHASNAV